jgi:hypothetical protein
MTKSYIGLRVEIVSRVIHSDLENIIEQYNSSDESRIFDPYTDGKITVERTKELLIARGEKNEAKRKQGPMVNFSLMIPLEQKEVGRVVQIVNVLGNGRLIRERINTFMEGNSTLNYLPELCELQKAIKDLNKYMPGIIRGGWYYAPEAKWK